MNEKEILEWLDLGLDIIDDLNNFKMNGKTLVQKTIEELTRGPQKVSMESALKIYKEIAKASERDMENFDINHTEVLRKDECQQIGNLLKTDHIVVGSASESIKAVFGEEFLEILKTQSYRLGQVRKEGYLSEDESLIYGSFVESLYTRAHWHRAFKPFITRTPADFLKSKDYLCKFLCALKKLPVIGEGTYCFLTKRDIDDFIIGETYVLPSFGLGTTLGSNNTYSDDKKYKTQGDFTFYPQSYDEEEDTGINIIYKNGASLLKISGRTSKGHDLKAYFEGN